MIPLLRLAARLLPTGRSTAVTSARRSLLGGRRTVTTTVTGPRAVIVAHHK